MKGLQDLFKAELIASCFCLSLWRRGFLQDIYRTFKVLNSLPESGDQCKLEWVKDLFICQSSNALSRHIFIKAPLNYIKVLQVSGSSAVGILIFYALRTDTDRVSKENWNPTKDAASASLLLERVRVCFSLHVPVWITQLQWEQSTM